MKNYIKNVDFRLIYIILFLAIYSIIFNYTGYKYSFIIVGIISFLLFFCKFETALLMYFCFLPYASLLKISENSITVLSIFYIIIIFKFILQNKLRLNKNKFFALLGLLFFQIICVLFYSMPITNLISFFGPVLFLLIVQDNLMNHDLIDLSLLLKGFIMSLLLSIVIVLIYNQIPFQILSQKAEALQNANRFSGINGDPNYFNQLVLIAISFLLILFIKEKIILKRIIYIICIGVYIYFGSLSVSKSYAIGILLYIFLAYLYLFKYLKSVCHKETLILIFIILTIIGIGLGLYLFKNISVSIFSNRQKAGYNLLTGRDIIWENNIEILLKNPQIILFGAGHNNEFIGGCPHNTYLELLKGYGVIGLIFICYLYKRTFRNIFKLVKNIVFLPVIMFLITAFSLSISATDIHYLLILYLIIYCRNPILNIT